MGIEILENNRDGDPLSIDQDWELVRETYLKNFLADTPPDSEQGELKVAYKLWHFNQIKSRNQTE